MILRKRVLSLFLLFFLLSAPGLVWSVDFSIDYAEGEVDVRRGNSWEEVYIGDVLSEKDTLRLSGYSVVEISFGREVLTLSNPGTYTLGSLTKDVSRRNEVGFSSLLSNKLQSTMTGSRHMEQSAAGGVRGSQAVENDQMTWMTSDTLDLIKAGREKFASGEYDTAADLFQEAYDYALDDEEEGKAAFYLAGSYDAQGKTGRAVMVLRGVGLSPDAEEYTDFTILKGKLLIETFAYAEAEKLLSGFDFSSAAQEDAQLVYFLLGVASLGRDKTAPARNHLIKARDLNPSTETGKAAAEMLGTL